MDSRLRGNDSGMFFVCRSLKLRTRINIETQRHEEHEEITSSDEPDHLSQIYFCTTRNNSSD
jgi:hypothetical protein